MTAVAAGERPRTQPRSLLQIAAVAVLGVVPALPAFILPGILATLASESSLTAADLAILGAAQMAAVTIALTGGALLVKRVDRRRMAWLAVLSLALGDALTIVAGNFPALVACRLLAGAGAGALTAVTAASISGMEMADRIFALNFALTLAASAVFFWLQPGLVAQGGAPVVLGSVILFTLVLAPAIFQLPPAPDTTSRASAAPTSPASAGQMPAILALVATLLLFGAVGSVWPNMPLIGVSLRIPGDVISTALARAAFAGLAAAMLASWLGTRIGRLIPLTLSAFGLAGGVASLLCKVGAGGFFCAVAAIMFCWVLSIPYYLGLMATVDRSGRLAALGIAAQTLALSLGQGFAAVTARHGDYSVTLASASFLAAGSWAIIVCAMRMARER